MPGYIHRPLDLLAILHNLARPNQPKEISDSACLANFEWSTRTAVIDHEPRAQPGMELIRSIWASVPSRTSG
jgi:hypothetical protein